VKIRLTVHGQPRPAPSTTRGPPRDFAALLPLILNMHDLGSIERKDGAPHHQGMAI
jgi:hypothetical protein